MTLLPMVLHAGTGLAPASFICRNPQYFLSHCDYCRTRVAYHACRKTGNCNRQYTLRLVHHLFVLAGLFLGVWIYHKFILPHPDSDHAAKEVSASTLLKEFLALLPVSFRKAGKYCYSLYVTLPFTGSTTGKMCIPFFIDPIEEGGLGLTTEEIGFVQGTVGIIGLTLGGILGGIAVARNGLKQWLWPMVWAISLPDLVYVYLSYVQPDSLYLINICIL